MLLIFVGLVIFFILDFDNLSNGQFLITVVAFVVYLGILTNSIKMDLSNIQKQLTPPFDKYVALPGKIKDMIGTEFDLYQDVFKGMKDVMGKEPNEQVVDAASLGGGLSGAALSNVLQEYHDIDKVFRDLRVADSALYTRSVYNNQ